MYTCWLQGPSLTGNKDADAKRPLLIHIYEIIYIYKSFLLFFLNGTRLHSQCQALVVGELICMAAKCWLFPSQGFSKQSNHAFLFLLYEFTAMVK